MYTTFLGTVFTPKAKKELKQVQTEYLEANAEYQFLNEVEHNAKDEACRLLNLITEENEPANHHNDYMLSDEDFQKMLLKEQEIIQAQGIKHDDADKVLSHGAWLKIRQAEKDLAAWGAKYIKDQIGMSAETWETMTTIYPHSNEFIKLTMKLSTK